MLKFVGEPVKAQQNKDSMITSFVWRRRLYEVIEVINWWRDPSEWCNGRAMRLFVRVIARNSNTGTFEIYQLGQQWFLSRVLD